MTKPSACATPDGATISVAASIETAASRILLCFTSSYLLVVGDRQTDHLQIASDLAGSNETVKRRMSKMEFRARPICHRPLEAIEARLTVVFTALAVARSMQAVTGLSLKKIIMTLRPLRESVGEIDGHELVFPPDFTPTAGELVGRIEDYGSWRGH